VAQLVGAVVTDCEVGGGALAQPVNAWSSLAFVAAGAWVHERERRRRLVPLARPIAIALMAVGAGSVAFHAAGGVAAGWMHDTALLTLLGLLALAHLGGSRLAAPRAIGPAVGAAATLIALTVPGATNLLVATLVAVALAAATIPWKGRPRRVFHGPLLATFGAAVAAFVAGRGDSAWCQPGSAVQFHALWHVLAAVGLAWWAVRALGCETRLGGAVSGCARSGVTSVPSCEPRGRACSQDVAPS
jgi:hypothetical protein